MEIRYFRLKRRNGTAVEIGESSDHVELIVTDTVRVNIWGEPSRDILVNAASLAVLVGPLRSHERDKLCKSIERATTTN